MTVAKRLPLAWLFPRPDEPGSAVVRRIRLRLVASLTVANLLGAAVVFAIATWAFPFPPVEDPTTTRLVNLVAVAVYLGLAVPLGVVLTSKRLLATAGWLEEDREPSAEERRGTLRAPRTIVISHVVLWSLAAVIFGILNATVSGELGQRVAMIVAMGGLTTCAVVYLVSERQLRPVAARALAAGVEDRKLGPGVRMRSAMAWMLGTGIALLGLMLVALSTLVEGDFSARELAIAVLVLAGSALVSGLYVSLLAARAVADPIASVSKALREVEEGDLDVEVPVYDASELGRLQAGFNRTVAGLRDRERIQDLFGRHVGEDVARTALEQEVELGGEVREVAVLFVDLVGSTKIAAERDPHDVVEILNRFFGVVVEVVRDRGGWVNKFEGDAALAVFGAPVPIDDPAGCALAAARGIAERLRRELDEFEAGVGVAYGEVVAGNIGEESRFEYTVIGDPVNEAARLTELAKSKPGAVLASEAAIQAARGEEAARWELGESVELRGRAQETRLALPAA